MKSLKYIITGFFIVFFAASCDKGFEEVNKDPNNPTEVPSSLLMADVQRNAANTLYSTFIGGDMGSCWAQHWSKVQYNDEERYSPRQSVIENVWDVFYEDVLADANTMEKLAAAEGNKVTQGAALAFKAYGFSVLTDLYGSIPLTQALRAEAGIFTPAYDPQDVVYDSIFAMLDRAEALIATGEGELSPDFDLLYGGNSSNWLKFVNSLRVRSMMRISGTSSFSASALQAAVNKSLFTSNSDEAKMAYLAAAPNANPIYETIDFGNRGEFKVSDVLVATLTDRNDPRLAVYAQVNTDGEYLGKPAGIRDVPNDEYNYNTVSPIGEFYLEATAPAYFMSYSELQFLLAEAAEAGYITGSAADYYYAGIAASMEANGITSGLADYIAQNDVVYSSANSDELIGTQKWLALYCQGVEAWTEWRRTGIPVLAPAIDANPIVPTIPSRYSYPPSEQTTNLVNYQAAVAAQGEDRLTTPLWWMQ